MSEKNYIPALRFKFLTGFYDPLVRLTTREYEFKRALLAQSNLRNDQTVLDLGCGTATLAIEIKKLFPEAELHAVDVDESILQMARAKAEKFGAAIKFERGFSSRLPYANQTFDRVFSTLAFHHLTHERKIATIAEILRVLKPGGEFHLADYGLPRDKRQFVLSKVVRAFDGFAATEDNLRGRLGLLMERNGFGTVERTGYFKTIIGTIRLFRAVKD